MQKELMVLFLFSLAAIVIVSETRNNGPTGEIASTLGQIRSERIGLYLSFPQSDNPSQRVVTQRVRKYLLYGARDDFFYVNNIDSGHLFFDNELSLVDNLMILACRTESFQCDEFLQQRATFTLDKVMELDTQLVEITIFNSQCPLNANSAMFLSHEAVQKRDYVAAITNLRVAWSKATEC